MAFNFTFSMDNVGKYDPAQNGFFFPIHAPILATIKQAYLQDENETVVLEIENSEEKSALIYLPMKMKDGKDFRANHQLFNDICYVLGLNEKGAALVDGEIEYYDTEAKAKAKKDGQVFINLVGKRIGVILELNHYYSPKYNTLKTNNRLYQVFNAETHQLAKQMSDGEAGEHEILLHIAEQAQASSENSKKLAEQSQKEQNSSSFGGAISASTTNDNPFIGATPNMGDWG